MRRCWLPVFAISSFPTFAGVVCCRPRHTKPPRHTKRLSESLTPKPPGSLGEMDLSGNAAVPGSTTPRRISKHRIPAPESGRLIEIGGTLGWLPPHPCELGRIFAAPISPRRTAAGLLRTLPGLSSRHRRHVRAHGCRHENPRHGVARNARPGSAEARCCALHSTRAGGRRKASRPVPIRGVSGHNGEHWSAIAGGLGRLLELGDTASAEEAQAAIEAEIDREQAVFDAGSRRSATANSTCCVCR